MAKKRIVKNHAVSYMKALVYFMGLAVLAVCVVLIPEMLREEAAGRVNPPSPYPVYVVGWSLSVPVFIALNATLGLLRHIETDTAFSAGAIRALSVIQRCAIIFGSMVAAYGGLAVVVGRSVGEDIAPVVTIGSSFIIVSGIVATFITVLIRLLREAITIKSEHDGII